jgi:hypothetical protein
MIEPGRKFVQGMKKYRYSINGQEKTLEIFEGSTTAEYWEYDSRIGMGVYKIYINHYLSIN